MKTVDRSGLLFGFGIVLAGDVKPAGCLVLDIQQDGPTIRYLIQR
ncbi:hypothetical protein PGS49_10915 [Yersinia intermedia]|jgi:hypothetical protein|nr:hypothetical protein [Yersinia intermedia]MCW8113592.1 hypothetical protein [Yersinia intermedia]MDA5481166.1 hypothetical protein [Yersinia intermedia]MDA5493938.1 hypothetical protein [Yersinia intermedia]MDA5518374.1 hypothetical protein [Yersinia intermedia]